MDAPEYPTPSPPPPRSPAGNVEGPPDTAGGAQGAGAVKVGGVRGGRGAAGSSGAGDAGGSGRPAEVRPALGPYDGPAASGGAVSSRGSWAAKGPGRPGRPATSGGAPAPRGPGAAKGPGGPGSPGGAVSSRGPGGRGGVLEGFSGAPGVAAPGVGPGWVSEGSVEDGSVGGRWGGTGGWSAFEAEAYLSSRVSGVEDGPVSGAASSYSCPHQSSSRPLGLSPCWLMPLIFHRDGRTKTVHPEIPAISATTGAAGRAHPPQEDRPAGPV